MSTQSIAHFTLKKKKKPLCPRAQVTDAKTANTNEVLELGFYWAMDGNTFTSNKQGLMGWILQEMTSKRRGRMVEGEYYLCF